MSFLVISDLREVFTKEKKDVFVFINHQNELLLKSYNNQIEYENTYVPFVIPICLNRILEMKKTKQVSNYYIYKALNGSLELTEEIHANLDSIINNINSGNWNSLKRCSDILVISELLFIWLDECVYSCIFPSTINEIFDKNKKLFEKKLSFTDYILDYKNLKPEIINQMYQYLKTNVKKYEWEIFKLFAKFFREIFPNNTNDKKKNYILQEEYQYMIEKIVIFILGYNIDMLYENQEDNKNIDMINISSDKAKYFQNVKITILLFKFLRDTKSLNKFSTIVLKKIGTNEDQMYNIDMEKFHELDNSFISNISNINISEKNDNILSLNNFGPEKEKNLYHVYQNLKNHFENLPYHDNTEKEKNELNTENSLNGNSKIEGETFNSIFNGTISSINESINSKSLFSKDDKSQLSLLNKKKSSILSKNISLKKNNDNRKYPKSSKFLSLPESKISIFQKKRNTKNLKIDNISFVRELSDCKKSNFYIQSFQRTKSSLK